jgi:hypothetical protein
MTIEVDKEEKEIVENLRGLSQRGRKYIKEKIQVRKAWEKLVATGSFGQARAS